MITKYCGNCKHAECSNYRSPCKDCIADMKMVGDDRPMWEPAYEEKEHEKCCSTCKHDYRSLYERPCKDCVADKDRPMWEPAKEDKRMEKAEELKVSIEGVRKIFLSLPMRNRSDEEIKNDIDKATELLKKLFGSSVVVNHSYITPLESDILTEGKKYGSAWYLGRALQIMAQCDTICRLPGCDEAYGCRVEETYAAWDQMNIINIHSWDENRVVFELGK